MDEHAVMQHHDAFPGWETGRIRPQSLAMWTHTHACAHVPAHIPSMTETRAETTDLPRDSLRVYIPQQAAEILQCSARFLVNRANAGGLPCLHIKKAILRFTSDHLLAIIHDTEQILDRFRGASGSGSEIQESLNDSAVADDEGADDIEIDEYDIGAMPGLNRGSKMRMAQMAAR